MFLKLVIRKDALESIVMIRKIRSAVEAEVDQEKFRTQRTESHLHYLSKHMMMMYRPNHFGH